MRVQLAPSLMCADLLALRRDIAALENAQADLLHIDIMDGHFVPNLGLGLDVTRAIAQATRLPVDVHLMVDRPEDYVERVAEAGVASVSFHVESTNNPIRLARAFKAAKLDVGIAINPATPCETLAQLIDEIDFVLAMTVEPGFAGQKFIPQVLPKIRTIRNMLDASDPGKPIEVDGNLDLQRSKQCIDQGASIIVAGTSSVFRPDADLYDACRDFKSRLLAEMNTGSNSLGAG